MSLWSSPEITHVALVVPDLEDAMRNYSTTLGSTWTEPWTGEIPILAAGSVAAPTVTFTYSRQGPPHLELIQAVPGTVWQPGAGIHHVGMWVDDVTNAAASVAQHGFVIEAAAADSSWTYVRSADGLRLELVNRSSRPAFDRWLRGGRL